MKRLSISQEANMLHMRVKSIIALHHYSDRQQYENCDKHVDDERFAKFILDHLEEDCKDYKNNIYPLLVEVLICCFNSLPQRGKKDLFIFYRDLFMECYRKYQELDSNEIKHHIPIFSRSFTKAETMLFGAP